ncbi:MAG: hypothetical protein ABIJ09_14375 [Pseudomonadota bacterium]
MAHRHAFTGLLALSLLAAAGCGPSEEVRTPLDADPAAEVAITNFTIYDGVMGSKEVMVYIKVDREISRVELLCDDATEPAASAEGRVTSLMWDSTRCAEGVVNLVARVVDEDDHTYDSPAMSLVVVNRGRVVSLTEGNLGTIRIPTTYDGTQEVDVKHHWNNPAGQTRVVAIATWNLTASDPVWMIEGSVGCGVCPHSGSLWGQPEETDASPFIIDMRASDINQTWLDTTQAFFHLRPLDAQNHLGENLPYTMAVYLFE